MESWIRLPRRRARRRKRADPQASCVRLDGPLRRLRGRAGSGAALDGASMCDRMRDVVADVSWQNLGAALHTGMFIPNEPPKVREGNDFMSQRPIDIADSGFVRFQIKNNDLETIWYAGVLNQFRCRHSLFPAVASRASLRRPRKHAE